MSVQFKLAHYIFKGKFALQVIIQLGKIFARLRLSYKIFSKYIIEKFHCVCTSTAKAL